MHLARLSFYGPICMRNFVLCADGTNSRSCQSLRLDLLVNGFSVVLAAATGLSLLIRIDSSRRYMVPPSKALTSRKLPLMVTSRPPRRTRGLLVTIAWQIVSHHRCHVYLLYNSLPDMARCNVVYMCRPSDIK